MTTNRPPEEDCVDTIAEAAQVLGFLVHHSRPARTAKGWRTPIQGNAGFVDLVIVGHGKSWFIEAKRRPLKPTPEQMLWATEMIKAGLDARLVFVPEESEALIAEMKAHYARSRHPSVGSGSY